MRRFALSAIGRDRPGIVAAVSRELLAHGLNIEDSQMSILGGYFAIVLVLAGSGEVDVQALRADLGRTAARLGLDALSVGEVGRDAGSEPAQPAEPSCIVTVYGADHPGIVAAVAASLAGRGVNITDLQTRLASERGGRLYAMVLELALPAGMGPADLDALLDHVRREQGVDVTVRELDRDVL